jgi:hypothetical protein
MNKIRLFQTLVVASTASYVIWFFLPQWSSHLSDPEYRLAELSGFGAVLPVDHPLYYGTWFVLWLIAALALLFFQNWARHLYLVLSVLELILAPFSGFSVQAPLDSLFGSAALLMDGAILAMAYLSPLAQHFENKTPDLITKRTRKSGVRR